MHEPNHPFQITGGRMLSRRQAEVVACVLDGVSNQAIAARLGLSVRTVEAYRSAARRQLRGQGSD